MRLVEAQAVPFLSPGLVKMDDRKRPAPHEPTEAAPPPSKKQATAVNGANKSHIDADMPWKDELEVRLPPSVSQIPQS